MRRGEYPGLSPTLRWIVTLAYTQPVNQWETGLLQQHQIIKKQSRALSRSLISEYPGYSLISEPITAREKHYSLFGYMLTVDIYFLLSNQSARKVLSTCLANTKDYYLRKKREKAYKQIEEKLGTERAVNDLTPTMLAGVVFVCMHHATSANN